MYSHLLGITLRRSLILAATLLAVLPIAPIPAQAVQGGSDATGDSRVVALVFGSNTRASCSGVPLSAYVVVAAGHCLSNPGYVYQSERYIPAGLSVSQPGVDLSKDIQSTRPKVLSVAVTPGYSDKSFADDIAFYFLSAPLSGFANIEISNLDELQSLKDNSTAITHVGYGYILPGNIEDFKPHSITLKASAISSIRFGYIVPPEKSTISTDESQGHALCKHDSGGPYLATFGSVEKLAAINLGADGCDRYGAGTSVTGTFGLNIYPYLDLLERNWKLFEAEHALLPNIQEASQVIAAKISRSRSAKVLVPTPSPSPSPSASLQPTAIAAPSPAPTSSASGNNGSKTISCIKGKNIKMLSSANPKCPKGYVLRK